MGVNFNVAWLLSCVTWRCDAAYNLQKDDRPNFNYVLLDCWFNLPLCYYFIIRTLQL